MELSRREPALIEGIPVYVAAAEDTILTKLEWARLGESERQLRDVAGIVRTSGETVDRAYLRTWAGVLGVRTRLDEALG